MDKSLVLDYVALAVYIVMLIANYGRTRKLGRIDRIFSALLIVSTITVVFDIIAVTFDRAGAGNLVFKNIFHIAYLETRMLILVVYSLYISFVTDTRHKFFNKIWFRVVYILPQAFTIPLIITSPFTKRIFYFAGEMDLYTRGPLFVALYSNAIVYGIFSILWIVMARKQLGAKKCVSLASMFILVVMAAVVQFLYPTYLVEMAATCFAIMFMLEVVQRPDTRLDYATKLVNNYAFHNDMPLAFHMKKPIHMIILDVINYDSIRSVVGHDSMQVLLARISEICRNQAENNNMLVDIYYRGSGRFRFVVERSWFDKTEKIAAVLNEIMQQEFMVGGMSVSLEYRICVAKCPEDIQTYEEFMGFEGNLHTIGFTGHVVYAKDILSEKDRQLYSHLDEIIENAMLNHKFEVYYQPIYDVKKQYYNSAEALLRLIDDEYGFVSPEIFIPAAEKSGAIHRIGAYVMEEVCQFIASESFAKTGLDYIEINLSVTQCMQKDLAKNITSIMEYYGVDNSQVNLEITETASTYSQETLTDNIDALTKEGITFSLDDYGTGYSNMNRIATMPLHIIKLDKSFTNAKYSAKMDIILKDTISMIKDLDLKIVAEGLETKDMVDKYSALGCDYIQGYYFSKPLPKDKFTLFLVDNKKGATEAYG
ncbi:MAG: EAL domain-containing protein [Lachnospiraceae bacterium]|nr:EAL domain-containing protein [Lachnospiraceae bacterium]